MSPALGVRLEGLLVRLLPPRDREAVAGDLAEDGPSGFRRLLAVAGIVGHVHAEPWRDPGARLGAASLLAGGLALLWAIPTAARMGGPDPAVYSGLLLEMATAFWRADHLLAAMAAGLVVGHAPGPESWARMARGHAALALALPAWTLAPTPAAGTATVALLWGSAWFGDHARRVEARSRSSTS